MEQPVLEQFGFILSLDADEQEPQEPQDLREPWELLHQSQLEGTCKQQAECGDQLVNPYPRDPVALESDVPHQQLTQWVCENTSQSLQKGNSGTG